MDEEKEKCESILMKCKDEIVDVLTKYGVDMDSDLFYNSSWIVLSIDGLILHKNKFGMNITNTYELKL